jgi:hypothetical protein
VGWVALAVALALLLGTAVSVGRVFLNASAAPAQPINFPHITHVQAVGLDCTFCHRTVSTGVSAGLPAVEQCMFCHQVVGHNIPEVQKVLAAAQNGAPIVWTRVTSVPDHVRFTHAPHVRAGVPCERCHGDVGAMTAVRQVHPLKMGDCVACHRQNSAPADCWVCHY